MEENNSSFTYKVLLNDSIEVPVEFDTAEGACAFALGVLDDGVEILEEVMEFDDELFKLSIMMCEEDGTELRVTTFWEDDSDQD